MATTSTIFLGTVKKPIARALAFFTIGEAHMAFVKNRGAIDEYWIDARGDGGVRIRPPEFGFHACRYLVLPFDIEAGVRSFIGRPYNYRGVIAQALHLRGWNDPDGLYCDQLVAAGARVSGHQFCDEGREDKLSPIAAWDMLCAYVRGLTGVSPTVIEA